MGWAEDARRKQEATMELEQGIRDLFGRSITEGDMVLLNLKTPVFFRIANITPVLDPAQPPGLMQVHCVTFFSLIAKRGTPLKEIVRVQTSAEAGPMPFKMLDAVPMPGQEPPS